MLVLWTIEFVGIYKELHYTHKMRILLIHFQYSMLTILYNPAFIISCNWFGTIINIYYYNLKFCSVLFYTFYNPLSYDIKYTQHVSLHWRPRYSAVPPLAELIMYIFWRCTSCLVSAQIYTMPVYVPKRKVLLNILIFRLECFFHE